MKIQNLILSSPVLFASGLLVVLATGCSNERDVNDNRNGTQAGSGYPSSVQTNTGSMATNAPGQGGRP